MRTMLAQVMATRLDEAGEHDAEGACSLPDMEFVNSFTQVKIPPFFHF